VQNGLTLKLTNPNDPPGNVGDVRYACDQLRRVVDSIR